MISIASVSGNGQRQLVEVLAGHATRCRRCLREPLKTPSIGGMSFAALAMTTERLARAHAGTLRRTRANDLSVLTTNSSRCGKLRSGGLCLAGDRPRLPAYFSFSFKPLNSRSTS
ncbi:MULTISPECIES: hypothetical protein [unclassified Bradyrhizobium]|uniref:hypothetical protein n=1 Tax=unclassified Bradyrhizobium TaxID=2631580 RepID=UPI0028E66DE1|nr:MULTISPECIES: hypothetical protein [unclassified Bradyrhizobium]